MEDTPQRGHEHDCYCGENFRVCRKDCPEPLMRYSDPRCCGAPQDEEAEHGN